MLQEVRGREGVVASNWRGFQLRYIWGQGSIGVLTAPIFCVVFVAHVGVFDVVFL